MHGDGKPIHFVTGRSSKIRSSLVIIEIIALEDKHYRPKTTKTVIEFVPKPKRLCIWKVLNILIMNANVHT